MKKLTHLNNKGQAQMVDIATKQPTVRKARAGGSIQLSAAAWDSLLSDNNPKGDVWATARIAGIMASKRTAEWIPLCHPLPIDSVSIAFTTTASSRQVHCECTVSTTAKTGVEMEALIAVQASLITLYDMLKAVDKGMVIDNIRLLEKTGGKSKNYKRNE